MLKAIPAIVLSASLLATPAIAGGLDVPVIEAPVIVEDAGSSASHDWVVPLMLIAVLTTFGS